MQIARSDDFKLPPRWTPLRHHPMQYRLWTSPARFKTVPAGRRSGKTELAKRKTILSAWEGTTFDDPRFFLGAPTRDQAKRIFWEDLKRFTPPWMIDKISESELYIRHINDAEVWVVGLDKPERIEGSPWDGGVIDEIGNVKAKTWSQHVRPALSDRLGWCWLIGVPEGRNHYYELDQSAQADVFGEWGSFHWKSADILPPSEIEAAKRDLDPLSYQQEYEASFVNFTGRAYYVFDSRSHCARLTYDPKQPIALCFDFNVAPGVAAVTQEQVLPSGRTGTGVIGEVWIPQNSNTPAVCRKLIKDWGRHEGFVDLYGDSTGGARGTAKVEGSDWDLVRAAMIAHFGRERVRDKVGRMNPSERARVNSVNTRFLNGAKEIHMMVDPSKAPHVVKDFEGVVVLDGGSGEIDKQKDSTLSHISDAVGYRVHYDFPLVGPAMPGREAY